MDSDGKSDIVTLDDSGEINILYGTERTIAGKTEHFFTKHLIESGLGLRLSTGVRNDGGAFSYTGLQSPNSSGNFLSADSSTGAINEGMINNIIYYGYNYQSDNTTNNTSLRNANAAIGASVGTNVIDNTNNTQLTADISQMIADTALLAGSGNTDFSALSASSRGSERTFIRSPFAEGKGLKVEKNYKIMTSETRDTMQTGDKIRVEIVLTNTSNKTFRDAVYLDSNDRKIFLEDQSGVYTLVRNGGTEEQRPLKYLTNGEFDYGFDFTSIASGEVIRIQYLITATPTAFGKMAVGLLEKGE